MTERESDTYRRGLTLGLTMAEIFILILFLLLLVLLALYAFNAETEKKLQRVEKQLEQIQMELVETKKQLQVEKDNTERLGKDLTALQNTINKLQPIPGDIQHITRDNESLTTQITVLKGKIATISGKLKTAEDQQAQTERELDTVETENAKLRAELSAEKGIDPPCWYQVTSKQGERHEKPYFLMDIAVYDKYLDIRVPNKAPPGHAIDELDKLAATSYQEEYEKLPLPLLGTTKKVSLQQFAEITEPIKRMGKNKQIRDYACVFYVKVWDFTPETAKTRWKQAEDAIKESFYTLRISKDPW